MGGEPARTDWEYVTNTFIFPVNIGYHFMATKNEADSGKLQVQGCSFGTTEASILLGKGLEHAVVTGNNGVKGVTITNQIGEKAIISGNESPE